MGFVFVSNIQIFCQDNLYFLVFFIIHKFFIISDWTSNTYKEYVNKWICENVMKLCLYKIRYRFIIFQEKYDENKPDIDDGE